MKDHYCICRSTKANGFMIACDRCDEWFHEQCVEISEEKADAISKWYCPNCLKVDKTLAIVYKGEPSNEIIKKETSSKSQEKHTRDKGAKDKSSIAKISKEKSYAVRFAKNESRKEKIQQENIPAKKFARTKERKTRNSGKKGLSSYKKKRGIDKRQCENPLCVQEARKDSNYCSDECGLELAKIRLVRHFIPKWQELKDKTVTSKMYKDELESLEKESIEHSRKVEEILQDLEKLEDSIKIIKETVRNAKHVDTDEALVSEEGEEDEEEDNEESEEVASAEVTKSFCVTCGMTILSDNAFKHWANCFKKHESRFQVSSAVECTFGTPDNRHPPIFCEKYTPKTEQYCKRFRGICAEHTKKEEDENEVCGCPLNIQQELILDGNYCQEKRSECTTHYQWDNFMKAQLNLKRLYHYYKLDEITEKIRVCRNGQEDAYGGIVGLMLHTTTDERSQPTNITVDE